MYTVLPPRHPLPAVCHVPRPARARATGYLPSAIYNGQGQGPGKRGKAGRFQQVKTRLTTL